MDQVRTVKQLDTPVKSKLEQRREERKQKLFSRLMRNQPNPSSMSSVDIIAGVVTYKKLNSSTSTSAVVAKTNSNVSTISTSTVCPKIPIKKSLSFRQTATSLKRANLATMGIQSYKASHPDVTGRKPVSTIPVPPAHMKKPLVPTTSSHSSIVKKPAATAQHQSSFSKKLTMGAARPSSLPKKPAPEVAPHSLIARKPASGIPPAKHSNLTRKLTMPKSPNFSSRLKEKSLRTAVPVVSTLKSLMQTPSKTSQVKKQTISGPMPTLRNPLTPKALTLASPARKLAAKTSSNPSTPNVKPFVRKSFTDVKVRPSVAFKPAELSQSMWSVKKEASEKEKVTLWLEKRGRSIASCRHLSCLGHKLEDFRPQQKLSDAIRKPNRAAIKQKPTAAASPQRESPIASILNTTFEKEEEEEEEDKENVRPPPAFNIDEVESADVAKKTDHEEVEEEEEEEEDKEEAVDEFQTPTVDDDVVVPDVFGSPSNDHVEKLLKGILDLFQEENYSEAKIEAWLKKSCDTFPAVKSHAIYWNIKARIAERQGNTYCALDIYNEAVQNKAEPLDMMNEFFNNFLQRVGSQLPTGQRTPLLKSLGVVKQRSRVNTPRKSVLDPSKAFNSSVIKYELKLMKMFQDMQDDMPVNCATPSRRMTRCGTTPMKVTTNSRLVSVANDETFQLVATPVRRSMRPRSMLYKSQVQQHQQHQQQHDRCLYVDDLDQLSPTTKAKVELRKNSALQ